MKRFAPFALIPALALACSSSSDAPAIAPASDAGSTPDAAGLSDAGVKEPPPPKLDALGPEFVDMGPQPVDFQIDVPPGTLGFQFEALWPAGEAPIDVLSVTDAVGTTYTQADTSPTVYPELRDLTRFPASSKMLAVPSGKWKVKISRPSVDVQIGLQRTSDGKFHGGVLDLWVHIPTGLHINEFTTGEAPPDVLTVATAPTNHVVQGTLDTFFANTKRILDLDKGKVTYVEADAKYLRLEGVDAVVAATLSNPFTKDDQLGLHLLFTEFDGDADHFGYAANTGGVGYDRRQGTVTVKMKDGWPVGATPGQYADLGLGLVFGDFASGTMLHEACHSWGLPHTSEAVDNYDDGFTDTGLCPKDAIHDFDKAAKCPDITNLMAPSAQVSMKDNVLSAHQLAVVRGVPMYRPYAPQ